MTFDLTRRLVAEALGTFFLVITMLSSGIRAQNLAGGNVALALLCNMVATGAVLYVIITMRSDFLGECSQFPRLADTVNEGEFLIPRLNRDQRKEAMREYRRMEEQAAAGVQQRQPLRKRLGLS